MVKLLKSIEKLKIKPLYEKTFVEDEEAYRQYFYNKVLPVSDVMVYENDDILGMITMIPKNITVGKYTATCKYIYGVATDAMCRRQGIMGKVMKDSLLFMKEDCFTYLIPSSPENAMIYKKYGFSFVADKCVEVGKVNDEISVRQATKADANRLALFAGKCVAERYGIYITKDDVYFEETLEKLKVENGFIQVYEDGKKIVGYRTGFEDEAIEVLYDQTVDKDCVCKKKSGGKPYIMARILNIEKMVSMLSVDCGDGGTDSEQQRELIIRITDPVIEENNGLYQLNCDAGQISLKKIKQDNKKIDMTVDIGQFTAHMMGYRLIEGIPKMSVREGVFINDYL